MPPRRPIGDLHHPGSNGSAKLVSKVSSILSGGPMTLSDSVSEQSSVKQPYQSAHPGRPPPAINDAKPQQPLSCSLPSYGSKDEVYRFA